ncbi:ABC transporter ATP-binding protein [Streptococcus merionis]|uniref:ABC transporter ATP-binding protein n=1 Tax=Streptococcus merionis TaxID=400065 RepID=UPI0026EA16ED|nr:ABC transporter ATP-binding protein [Streptococcus merionis]
MLELKNICYSYARAQHDVLDDVNYTFKPEIFYSIIGTSGSGKTTLLSLLAGLDTQTSGEIRLNEKNIQAIGYQTYRKKHVSLVFQNYNLLDYMTPLENIRLVNSKADASLLLRLGLQEEQLNRNVLQLSGGQRQRVAIARALSAGTELLLLDEPTGNLDEKIALEIVELLKEIAHQEKKCVIMVTHSQNLAKIADVQLKIQSKKLREII